MRESAGKFRFGAVFRHGIDLLCSHGSLDVKRPDEYGGRFLTGSSLFFDHSLANLFPFQYFPVIAWVGSMSKIDQATRLF